MERHGGKPGGQDEQREQEMRPCVSGGAPNAKGGQEEILPVEWSTI